MKRLYIPLASVLLILFFALPGLAHEDTRTHQICGYCNMDREAFAYSRALVSYSDGTSVGTCSIHCVAIDLIEKRTKVPCRVLVGDYVSRKLIDATTAFWVIGGDKQGVMTEQAKWAFEQKADADMFIKEHGGKRATFYDALQAAYQGLFEDMKTTIDRMKERKAKGRDMCEHAGQ
jgi:hypothetical protein